MAQETIQAVRQAELKAEETEKAAQQQLEAMRKAAQEKARQLKEEMTKAVKADSMETFTLAKEQGEAIIQAAEKDVQQEISLLREKAEQKQGQAISLILDQLV